MKEGDPITLGNFISVIEQAAKKAAISRKILILLLPFS